MQLYLIPPDSALVPLTCARCGTMFTRAPKYLRRFPEQTRWYCSRRCNALTQAEAYHARTAPPVHFVCPICQTAFTRPHQTTVLHPAQQDWYCSRACAAHARRRRVALICSTCGRSFQRAPWQVPAQEGPRYCSVACRNLVAARHLAGYERHRVRTSERFWRHVEKTDGCWLWTGRTANGGYGLFQITVDSRTKQGMGAHRFAWTLEHGPIPHGAFVCHHCDNRLCVRPAHLFLGTNGDNMRDMWRKRRQRRSAGSREP